MLILVLVNMAQEIKKYNRNKNNCRLHPDRGVLMQLGLYLRWQALIRRV